MHFQLTQTAMAQTERMRNSNFIQSEKRKGKTNGERGIACFMELIGH